MGDLKANRSAQRAWKIAIRPRSPLYSRHWASLEDVRRTVVLELASKKGLLGLAFA
jgi:hypothetical protein